MHAVADAVCGKQTAPEAQPAPAVPPCAAYETGESVVQGSCPGGFTQVHIVYPPSGVVEQRTRGECGCKSTATSCSAETLTLYDDRGVHPGVGHGWPCRTLGGPCAMPPSIRAAIERRQSRAQRSPNTPTAMQIGLAQLSMCSTSRSRPAEMAGAMAEPSTRMTTTLSPTTSMTESA